MVKARLLPQTMVQWDHSGAVTFFHALGDIHRLTIIVTLLRARRPLSVRTMSVGLPINQSSVSHHLTVLRDAGIVVSERRGTWGFYQIAPEIRSHLANMLKAVLRERCGPSEQS
jgi:ArsR family transcriptional regulator, arsenate/arsenite/antimonite-responsive transcriptional repressor